MLRRYLSYYDKFVRNHSNFLKNNLQIETFRSNPQIQKFPLSVPKTWF
eukprot:UN27196